MNVTDLFLFVIILLNVFSGYHKGLILGVIDLFLLFASLAFAFWVSGYVAMFFQKYIVSIGVWALPLAFILSFIFANAILTALVARLIVKLPAGMHENVANKA
jgi:uncharacterized membrane protein required for colicin V production